MAGNEEESDAVCICDGGSQGAKAAAAAAGVVRMRLEPEFCRLSAPCCLVIRYRPFTASSYDEGPHPTTGLGKTILLYNMSMITVLKLTKKRTSSLRLAQRHFSIPS